MQTTEGHLGRIPRVYIKCLKDRIISPKAQGKMSAALPCEAVFALEADHMPFFSTPLGLTETFIKTAEPTKKVEHVLSK